MIAPKIEAGLILLLTLLLGAFPACKPSGGKVEVMEKKSSGRILRVAVSDESSSIAKALLEDFSSKGNVSFALTETHSLEAKNHVVQDSADVAVVTKRITPSGEDNFIYIPFAFNGIIFLADSEANVTGLTRAQVADIFSGKVKNWKEVGGKDLPITVIQRPPNSSAKRAVENILLGEAISYGKGIKSFYAETNMAALSATRRIKGFFSFVLISGTSGISYRGIPLSIEGMEPLRTNVPQMPYPVPMEVAFIAKPDYGTEVRSLLDYTLSNRGVHEIAGLGLVPVSGTMKISDCHCMGRSDGTVVPSSGRNLGTLTLGIVPELGVTTQDKRYRELAGVIADRVHLVVRLRHFHTYERVVEEFRNGSIEAAFVGSLTYGLLRKEPYVEPLARPVSGGKSEYRGVLIVLNRTGIGSFQGLRGKKVAYVPYTTAGELFMKGLVREAGSSPKDYFRDTLPVLTHEESVNELVKGRVDGAFVKDLVLERILSSHPELKNSITVLETSGEVPENALVVTKEIYRIMGDELRTILVDLDTSPDGRRALKEFGADEFVTTSHEDYKNLYMIATQAGEKI